MSKSKKLYFVMLGVVLALCLGVGAIVYLGNAMLSSQSKKVVSLKLDNEVIESQQTALGKAKQDVQRYTALDQIAKQIVPQDKDQAKVTREIVSIATDLGIKISNVTFPASSLGTIVPKQPSSSTTPAPVPTTPTTQLKAVDGISNLYQLDITITSDTAKPISYNNLIAFLDRMEQNRRTSQVTQITITPDSKNRSLLNFSITLTVYTKP